MTDLALSEKRAREQTLKRIEAELQRDPRLLSAHSQRAYLSDLTGFETWRAGRPITKLLVEEYAAGLQKNKRSPNSINRALAAVRWWARRMADLAYESRDLSKEQRDEVAGQAARVAAVHDVAGQRLPKGRHIAPAELSALLQVCAQDETPAGARDAALFAAAWSTGLRRSELCSLNLTDWKEVDGQGQFRVRGKGNKVRIVYLHRNAQARLQTWRRARGGAAGPLFCPVRKGGTVAPGRGLTDEGLAQLLAKRAKQAGLAEHVTWHDFRRTFAGNLLDKSVDLVTVQKLLGHSSPVTTSNYDRRGESARQRAAEKIELPDE